MTTPEERLVELERRYENIVTTRIAPLEAALTEARGNLMRIAPLEAALGEARARVASLEGNRVDAASIVDKKLLSKPFPFDGDQKSWRDWSFVFKAYIAATSASLKAAMDAVATSDAPINNSNLTNDEAKLSIDLYYTLVLMAKDRALPKLQSCPENQGLEAWRQYILEYEPRANNRLGVALDQIIKHRFVEPIIQSLEAWETLITKYNQQSVEKLGENIMLSLLTNNMDIHKIKDHLALNAARMRTYADVRAELVCIGQASKDWSTASQPMIVDAVTKGKGKGKEGKEGKKGGKDGAKGKPTTPGTRTCRASRL